MSHNSMAVFFSTTDMDELIDNVVNHQYYLSLVVNNKGDMIAKLCYIGKQETKSKISVKNKLGTWIKLTSSKQAEEEVMFVNDCNISLMIPDATEFVERFKEVTTKIKTPSYSKTTPTKSLPPYTPKSYGYYPEDEFDNYYDRYSDPDVPTKKKAPDYQKRTTLAKALVSCKVSGFEGKTIYEVINEAKATFKGTDLGTITDSYEEFYRQDDKSNDNFILEAYADVYNRPIDMITVGEIQEEVDAAVKLLFGEIGEAITEATDNYILSLYERETNPLSSEILK